MTPASAGAPVHRNVRSPMRIALPLLACLLLYGIDLACTASVPASGLGYAVGFALPFDLMVCVPAAFYFLVVRRNGLSPLLVLPVIWIGGFVSLQFAIPGQPSILVPLSLGAVVVEATVAARELRRFVRTFRKAKTTSDNPLDWFSDAFFTLVRNERAARTAGFECAMWYYAAASWHRKPFVPEGYRAFSSHRRSGYVAVAGIMLGLIAIETFAVHLLVARFSTVAACALTALSLYTMLWMIAETRAVVLNPLLVGNGCLVARWGMLTCERIPLSIIADASSKEPDTNKRERLDLAAMGGQALWIELSEAVEVRGFLGRKRLVRAIKTSPDEADAFKRAILANPRTEL